MTTIRSAHKRKAVFRWPALRKGPDPKAVRGTVLAMTGATSDRVLDNTPCLQKHYALIARLDLFLKGPLP